MSKDGSCQSNGPFPLWRPFISNDDSVHHKGGITVTDRPNKPKPVTQWLDPIDEEAGDTSSGLAVTQEQLKDVYNEGTIDVMLEGRPDQNDRSRKTES
jgi:hypothetical protein